MLINTTKQIIQRNQSQEVDSMDINEQTLRENIPKILDILLIDRTMSSNKTKKNIIWANDNYLGYGVDAYSPHAQILPELITGQMKNLIKPRALKSEETQKQRTKTNAEVFTPTWIVKKQNDEIDQSYRNDDLEKYINRSWLEITCGEAPYMASRYDMETGNTISLPKRVGFVDRKLSRINQEVNDKSLWEKFVIDAYKSSYGFEWNGDSLLLARENLLYSFRDYYCQKWGEEPSYASFETIAKIISYNIFQMDGLKYIIPLTEENTRVDNVQMSLFDEPKSEVKWEVKPGKRVRIMNWKINKMEFFDKGIK